MENSLPHDLHRITIRSHAGRNRRTPLQSGQKKGLERQRNMPAMYAFKIYASKSFPRLIFAILAL
jgi:hypothetical protein